MKWSTHIKIADTVYDDLIRNRFPDYRQSLRDGSIYPDKKDFKKTHHYDRENDVERNVEKARELRLSGYPEKALFRLGIALHYIQDKWTALDSSSSLHESHEENIDSCEIHPFDFELSGFYPVMDVSNLNKYEQLSKVLETKLGDKKTIFRLINVKKPLESTAFLDLNIAYRISYRITEMVMDSLKSQELKSELEKCHEEYYQVIHNREQEWNDMNNTLKKKFNELEKTSGLLGTIKKKSISFRRKKQHEKITNELDTIRTEYYHKCKVISQKYEAWYKIPPPLELTTLQVDMPLESVTILQI